VAVVASQLDKISPSGPTIVAIHSSFLNNGEHGVFSNGQDLQNSEPAFLLSTFPREGEVQIYFINTLLIK
jgi:hypothetical protein